MPGEVDASFDTARKGVGLLSPEAVTIDRKGRLLVTGRTGLNETPLLAARFTPGGAFDTSFAKQGMLSLQLRPKLPSGSLTATADDQDRVWIGGTSVQVQQQGAPSMALVVRLLEDGSLDASFNPKGEFPGALAFTPRNLSPDMLGTRQSVTQVLVGGGGAWLGGLAGSFFLERVTGDGTIDPTFQAGAFGPRLAWAYDLLLLPAASVAAYGADGTPRQDFGAGGLVKLSHPEDGNTAFSTARVLAQGPDKLLLVETYPSQNHVARITRAGKLDTSFGTGGFSAAFDCSWHDAAVVCDGKIALAGYRPRASAPTQYCAVVLTPDGQPVQGSPADGVFIWDEASAAAGVSSAIGTAIDATTGSVVYIHGNTGSLYMARINLPR